MHDSIKSELLDVPSFGIMTSKFISAAEMMSQALGAKNYPFVTVSHPISNATKDELKIQAGNALKDGIDFLLKSGRSTET